MSAGSASPAALEVCELCAGYQMMPRAIADINFIVQPGESVAILGPNGAGKSTLLLALAGLVPHDTGEVRVHGHDCQHLNVQIGLVPQRNAMDPNFPVTVEEVVMMGCTRASRWLPWWPQEARRRASEVLEMLDLDSLAKRPFSALSGGQQHASSSRAPSPRKRTFCCWTNPLAASTWPPPRKSPRHSSFCISRA